MAWQVTDVQKSLKGADYPATGEVSGPDQVMKELSGKLGGSS